MNRGEIIKYLQELKLETANKGELEEIEELLHLLKQRNKYFGGQENLSTAHNL